MKKSNSYSPEVRERAVRMVLENVNDYPSEWAAICASVKAASGRRPVSILRTHYRNRTRRAVVSSLHEQAALDRVISHLLASARTAWLAGARWH